MTQAASVLPLSFTGVSVQNGQLVANGLLNGPLAQTLNGGNPVAFTAPLELTAHSVRGEPVTFSEAVRGDYRPFHVGEKWGPPWSTTWFHVRGQVPVDWTGKRVVAVFDIGFQGHTGFTCEALAWRDGKPWRGVDPNHRWLPVASSDVEKRSRAGDAPGRNPSRSSTGQCVSTARPSAASAPGAGSVAATSRPCARK